MTDYYVKRIGPAAKNSNPFVVGASSSSRLSQAGASSYISQFNHRSNNINFNPDGSYVIRYKCNKIWTQKSPGRDRGFFAFKIKTKKKIASTQTQSSVAPMLAIFRNIKIDYCYL